jgi:hypothetical protein
LFAHKFLPVMYNVCDNESACNKVYHNNGEPQEKTS